MTYQVITHSETLSRAESYARRLTEGSAAPGHYLSKTLAEPYPPQTAHDLLAGLLRTKRPQIFAESAVRGDGSDWNATELELLGDISIAADVRIFDDGRHRDPTPHDPPFAGTLIFTCGALLRNGRGTITPDLAEIAPAGEIDQARYNALYARRLSPVLGYIQSRAESRNRDAVVTVPGLGCGQFAGAFRGAMGLRLEQALIRLLEARAPALTRVRTIIFDPYDESVDSTRQIGPLELRTRPLTLSQNPHPQLCRPTRYEEKDDDFSDRDLYSLVAWDHVSWPGNDYFIGARATDDGVKAAATTSMRSMTGLPGHYDRQRAMYLPPDGYRNWADCVARNSLKLELGELFVYREVKTEQPYQG